MDIDELDVIKNYDEQRLICNGNFDCIIEKDIFEFFELIELQDINIIENSISD